METSLHRELKERHGREAGGRVEVTMRGYRIDAVAGDGTLVEVQSGALGPLRGKLAKLLDHARIRIVKPVVIARRVVKRAKRDGADLSARFSPRRGRLLDVFDDLIGLARVFPHPNLEIEVLAVEIDEVRANRRRWPGYTVVDRRLRQVLTTTRLRSPADLWALLPESAEDLSGPFTTRDLAECLECPRHIAQRIAYCLRHTGAVEPVGKQGNGLIYLRRSARGGAQAIAVPVAAGLS